MALIHRKVSNYQGAYAGLNTAPNEATYSCNRLDICRCIVTVGNPSFISLKSIRQYGFVRAMYDSILEKSALVMSNIRSTPAGMQRHPVFDTYVSDKKRIVSYNLAMAFAKLYAERLLDIPNLVHVEFLKKTGAITFAPQPRGRRHQEPDLVGQSVDGAWHVLEAKGVSTSEAQLSGKLAEAKVQIQQVSTIHGAPPATGSACATYIGSDRIFTRIEDPPSVDGRRIVLDREKFYETYYAPFLLAKNLPGSRGRKIGIDGLEVDLFEIEAKGGKLRIGLESEVADRVRSKDYRVSLDSSSRLALYSSQDFSGRYSIGLDGFVVGYGS